MWIATALLLAASAATSTPIVLDHRVQSVSPITGTATRASSANFEVYSRSLRHDARQIAFESEATRARLHQYWRGRSPATVWQPRCTVVIHAHRSSYVAAVGRSAAQTLGTSWIEFGRHGVKTRRIDLLVESGTDLAALPHELTHIWFADFLGRQPPRWIDEGVAILADSAEKRRLHELDLRHGLAHDQTFRCAELLTLVDYPAPQRVAAFYGQSASLVTFLAQRGAPATFLRFAQRSQTIGYDRALREVYGIRSVAELERQWIAQHGPVAELAHSGAE